MRSSETASAALNDRIRDWLATEIGGALAEGEGQSVVITDANRLVVWVNRSFAELTGFELEEIIGRTPGSLLQGLRTDPESVLRLRTALDAGRSVSEDILNYRKSGEPYWIRMRINPIRTDEGHLLGFIGLGIDQTSHKLLESHFESHLEPGLQPPGSFDHREAAIPLIQTAIARAAPVAILTDSSGIVRHLSASGALAFGYSPDEVVDRLSLLHLAVPVVSDFCYLFPPLGSDVTDPVLLDEALNCMFCESYGKPVEVLYRTRGNRRGKALLISTPLGLDGEYANGYSCLLLGIEPGKSDVHSELSRSADTQLGVPGALFQFVSQNRKIIWTYFPRSAAHLLGLRHDGSHPIHLREFLAAFHREDRRRILERVVNAHDATGPLSIMARLERTDSGKPCWVRITAAPEARPGGSFIWHGFILDESIRVRAELKSERKSTLLALMVDVTANFVDAHHDHLDRVIDDALARAGMFFGVDRTFVFEYDFVAGTSSNTHEWVSDGTEPFKDILQGVAMEGLEDWLGAHLKGEVINIPDVDSLPHEATRQLPQMQGIKSVLSVPLTAGDTCIGFVGFDGVREARAFSEGEISLLRAFSKNIVALIERSKASAELEHSRQRLLDVISAAGEFVWEIDRSGRFTYISEQSAAAFGRDPALLIDRGMASFVPGSLVKPVEDWLEALFAEPIAFADKEYFVQMDDGTLRVHSLSGSPIRQSDGTCSGYRGMGLDVTRERKLSQSLQEAQKEIETFFDVAIDLVLICDADGNIVRLSKSWEKVMEMPVEKIQGKNVLEFILPDDSERTSMELSELKLKPRTVGFINRWISGKGNTLSLEWTAAAHQGLVFACARDISLRQEAESIMRQALETECKSSEIRGRLIAMASHEFRTPLAAIRLAAEVLRNRVDVADSWMLGKIDTIIARVDSLETVVSDVLDLQRMRESQRTDINPKMEKLSTVLEDVCSDFDNSENDFERISLRLDGHFDALVPSDPVRRIMRNLIENALKYSPADKPVLVWTKSCKIGIEICVIDEGPGVRQDETNLIFNDFFRGENSIFLWGTGLGLPIAREAAMHIGGRLVYDREPGGPTVFTLRFPAS